MGDSKLGVGGPVADNRGSGGSAPTAPPVMTVIFLGV